MRPVSAADVAGYLLERGLLDPRAVVHARLTVVDRSGLNDVFVVTAEGEPRLVLKSGPSVPREAAVLERLRAAAGAALARALPVPITHDPAGEVLVLAAAPGARDLTRHHARGRFSRALAGEAGRALALLHAVPPEALDGLGPLPPAVPPHRPDLVTLRTLSGAAVELTRIVQRSADLCSELDALLARPAAAPSVIHGDVRWGNLVALRGGGRWSRLQLVDWEHCALGDPAADVGAFIGEYLRAWRRSIPVADPRDAGPMVARARAPLRRMRPALRAFWSAYVRHRRGDEAPGVTLRRSLRFAGVRLLLAAYEEAQAADELGPRVLGLLPLSHNVLSRPDEALELLELA
jgi:aminoglycoside phosphotransferase (APT) family kinase protein